MDNLSIVLGHYHSHFTPTHWISFHYLADSEFIHVTYIVTSQWECVDLSSLHDAYDPCASAAVDMSTVIRQQSLIDSRIRAAPGTPGLWPPLARLLLSVALPHVKLSSRDRCKNMSQGSRARMLTPRQKRDTHAVGGPQLRCQYTMLGDRWVVLRRVDLIGRGTNDGQQLVHLCCTEKRCSFEFHYTCLGPGHILRASAVQF